MAISRMQQPRQQYGLGSLVKKAVRGVKKIVKSPIGKAALGIGLAGMPFGGGSWFGAGSGWGKLAGMMGGVKGAGKFPWSPVQGSGKGGFFTKGLGRFLNPWQSGQFSGKHAFGLASAAALAAPFLMGKDEPEEEVEESWTSVPSSIADIRNQARNYYTLGSAGSNLNFMPGKQFVNANYYAADGGRVGLLNGGEAGQEQIEQMLMAEFVKYKNQGGKLTFEQFVQAVMQAQQQQPEGAGMEQPQEVAMAANGGLMGEDEDEYNYNPQAALKMYRRPGKQEGGIMETEEASEMIDMGGQEKDYRETGGFVEIGGKERADDVPARLSKNEFVFTADAVRAAGGGDIDAGSEVMQNMMDNLEAGGEISEESQGLEGAQAMYDQQQMLQSRIA
jgi:hypothetical protein